MALQHVFHCSSDTVSRVESCCLDPPPLLRPVLLSDLVLEDLADGAARQFRPYLYGLWCLDASQAVPAVGHELGRSGFATRLQFDHGLDGLAPLIVRYAN